MSEPDNSLHVPDFSLVVLIGAAGSGKSTFAAKHFRPTEAVSSDYCRALIGDDETDQSATTDAIDLMREIAARRLKHRKLAVIDASNIRAADRKRWVQLAREFYAPPVAIVLDPSVEVCVARNKQRAERASGGKLARQMTAELRRGLGGLHREGFRQVCMLDSVESIESVVVARQPLATDKREDSGPFDIIGDIHGCASEFQALLAKLGYRVEWAGDGEQRSVTVIPPRGRKLVLVGDLVDRGPNSPDVLRIAMSMTAAGDAYVVEGNHDNKLMRWLNGRNVTVASNMQRTLDQLASQHQGFRDSLKKFLEALPSHVWLDGGRLAVAHAGLKEEMIGRDSSAVREFALYGETTGEHDASGAPIRVDWAANYRGATTIVYGHTPLRRAEWFGNILCVDTGCVFGGRLTALRWPERELVDVAAERVWSAPTRSLGSAAVYGR